MIGGEQRREEMGGRIILGRIMGKSEEGCQNNGRQNNSGGREWKSGGCRIPTHNRTRTRNRKELKRASEEWRIKRSPAVPAGEFLKLEAEKRAKDN
jgi:hypothetical protein